MIHRTRTFRLLLVKLPPDLVTYIFELWIGPSWKTYGLHTLAYHFGRYRFVEGVQHCVRVYANDPLVLNQVLYGAATAGDRTVSLWLLEHGATDVETAVNLALAQGFLAYVRTVLYHRQEPWVPLSITSWARYCKTQ